MEERKVLLSIKDLEVKFRVRGRILTAIRGIDLDIYENESIAIVGESGSGKSVFTRTFAGMLDQNGFIDKGHIIYNDEELADTYVAYGSKERAVVENILQKLNEYSKLENGAETYREILQLKKDYQALTNISAEDEQAIEDELSELNFRRTEAFNLKQTFDPRKEKERIKETAQQISQLDAEIKALKYKKESIIKEHKAAAKQNSQYKQDYEQKLNELNSRYAMECQQAAGEEALERNEIIAKEI